MGSLRIKKLKKKKWLKLLYKLPTYILIESWKNNLWKCKRDGMIIKKEEMYKWLIRWKDIKIWKWWKENVKGDNLGESMTKLETIFLNKKGKQLNMRLKFIRNKMKTVHKVLVRRMPKIESYLPS